MAQRARDQYISIYEQPKKPDKPKVDPVVETLSTLMVCVVLLFFGIPVFCWLVSFAMAFWFPHSYRYYP